MLPDSDAPLYQNGFIVCICLQVIAVISACCIPYSLLLEAERRKRKNTHAMPLTAILDAENAQVSDAAMARMHAMQAEETARQLDKEELKGIEGGSEGHVEDIELASRKSR